MSYIGEACFKGFIDVNNVQWIAIHSNRYIKANLKYPTLLVSGVESVSVERYRRHICKLCNLVVFTVKHI